MSTPDTPTILTLHCPDCRHVHVRTTNPHTTRQVFGIVCLCRAMWDVQTRTTLAGVRETMYQRTGTLSQSVRQRKRA